MKLPDRSNHIVVPTDTASRDRPTGPLRVEMQYGTGVADGGRILRSFLT